MAAYFILAYGLGIFVFFCAISIWGGRKSMAWYKAMAEEEKKKFWGVIAVSVIGTMMILLVPVVFVLINNIRR